MRTPRGKDGPKRPARPERGTRSRIERPVRKTAKRPTRSRTRPVAEPEDKPLFPMRLNKFLALRGFSTRREADALIEKKQVLVNGHVAGLGDRVLESDTVEVRRNTRPAAYAYLAYNKPVGMDTHQEDTGTRNILDSLPADIRRLKLFPIGRLDKASHGLIILTNDGRVTDRLLNPKHAHEKTYEITTKEPLRTTFKERMEAGVNIEGYQTQPTQVEILGESRFRITLTEGKSHQIRRMVVALFNEVQDLKRTRIMNIKLGPTKNGGYRVIEGDELREFLHALGLA